MAFFNPWACSVMEADVFTGFHNLVDIEHPSVEFFSRYACKNKHTIIFMS